MNWRRIFGIAAVLVLMMFLAHNHRAQATPPTDTLVVFNFPNGKGAMYLGTIPCTLQDVIVLYGNDVPDLRYGFVTWDNDVFPGCWYKVDDGRVLFIDTDGNTWLPPTPYRWFHKIGAPQTLPSAPKVTIKPRGDFCLDTLHDITC